VTTSFYVRDSACVAPINVTVPVTVHPLPSVTITPSTSIICPGNLTQINLQGGSSYTWISASGTIAVTQTPAMVQVTPTITTTYTVNSTNIFGCNGKKQYTVSVSSCLGIDGHETDRLFMAYPNPAKDQLFLSTNENEEYSFQLIDLTGRKVMHGSEKGTSVISLFGLPDGLYFLQISGHEANETVKIIKLSN
jgi:hypothetical protein